MSDLGLNPLQRELWVPAGVREREERVAAKAVDEYDSSLMLGYRKDVGEWVVFIRNGPNGEPFPVLGLGAKLPDPDEIKRRLYKADTKRRGTKIVDEVQRNNDRIVAEGKARADAALEVAAEGMEWFTRKEGLRGNGKVFIPRGVNA